MPISEDEYDYRRTQDPQTTTTTSTMSKAELRKTHKPIMEKRRRARINHCLNEIKTLILEAMNKDPARHSKLEKADILEMAVKHLQNVQRQQLALAIATDPSVLRKFKSGFNECAEEIDKFMGHSETIDGSMKQRVSTHLQKCISGIEQVAQLTFPGLSSLPLFSGSGILSTHNQEPPGSSGDQNNNPRIQIPSGLQLIPSRLPTGELALLVPNSSNLPYFPPQRPSAFVTVTPQNRPLSPPVSPVSQERSQSPQGFRPVQPSIAKPKPNYPGEDHQVPQVSSTVSSVSIEKHQFLAPMEVKTMKFPMMHKDLKKIEAQKKLSEPLCIITNQAERHKQAQMKEDSAYFEENLISHGLKRKYNEISQGILTTTLPLQDFSYLPKPKIIKTQYTVPLSSFLSTEKDLHSPRKDMGYSFPPPKSETVVSSAAEITKKIDNCQPSSSKDSSSSSNVDSRESMWRPW